MKKLAFLGGAVGVGMIALLGTHLSHAADHLDSLATLGPQPMADINDLFVWNTSDATKVNLALTVSPADPGSARSFGPTIQYVFHITSHAAFGMAAAEKKIICTFTSDTNGQCWLTDNAGKTKDYVSGDLSAAAGRVSASGKFRVFAGERSDPFFFNLTGFRTAVRTVTNAGLTAFDSTGNCPLVTTGTAGLLRSQLQGMPSSATDNGPCGTTNKDCFIDFNVKAIVIQVDKAELLEGTDKIISVWASTYAAP